MKTSEPTITGDQALRVAAADAEKVYPDLHKFRVVISSEDDGWHVEYWVKEPFTAGGGPHYVIDAVTGTIRSKKYYQ